MITDAKNYRKKEQDPKQDLNILQQVMKTDKQNLISPNRKQSSKPVYMDGYEKDNVDGNE